MINFQNCGRKDRKVKRHLLFWFSLFCFAGAANSQTDTSFWFAAPAVTVSHENKPIVFRMATYSQPADITISQPANPSFIPVLLHLNSNSAITYDLTTQLNQIENKPGNTILNYGLKIISTTNISAYYEVGKTNNPEIFPLKGQIGMGLSFLIPMQTRFDNHAGHIPPAHNGFAIVATENNTTVTIIPTDIDSAGHAANVPFTIILQKGQSYAVIASSNVVSRHLGGSTVKADKPVCVTIYDDSVFVGTSYDLIGDQIVPEINTGSEFIIVRGAFNFSAYPNQDFYYVWATVDNTIVSENGIVVATINRGKSYEGRLSNPSVYITTSQPVYVLQLTGVGIEVAATSLPGIKCTGSQTVSFVRSTTEAFYLNILCKPADIGNFLVNGTSGTGAIIPTMFQPVPGTNGVWMAARIDITNFPGINAVITAGNATSVSNSTGLFHLGFLNGGASSGSRLGYFSNYSRVQLSPVVTSSTCAGANVQLYVTPYSTVTYQWAGPNSFSSTLYNPVIPNASMGDSGKYYVTANIGGCGITTDSLTVDIHPLPTIQFVKSLDTTCLGTTKNISFSLTGNAPWNMVYSDGVKNDTLRSILQPLFSFSASPIINTVYSVKSLTDTNACAAAGTATVFPKDTIVVNKLPVADLAFSTLTCEKNAVSFTDKSKADLDTLVHWYWQMGNGTVRDASDKDPFTLTYNSWGDDTVKLAVQSSMGCKSDTLSRIITIHPLPQVGFIIPEVCLNDASALFTDTTRLADGTKPKTFAWTFDASTASPIVPLSKYPVPGTSALQNPSIQYGFSSNYKVKEIVTSSFGCIDSLTQNFTVNGAKPKASFVVLDSTRLCSNLNVQLQNFSTVDFGTVSRLEIIWNTNVDSLDENPVTGKKYGFLYPDFQTPATKKYAIKMIARSGNSSVCADSVTSIVTLRQSPKVSFTTLPGICNDTTPRQIKEAKETGGVPGTFAYFGTGVSATGVSTPQAVASGNYPVKYVYTTALGCSDSASQNLTVWPSPVAKWNVGLPTCEKNQLLFTDSSLANYSTITNRFWSFGDGTIAVKTTGISFTKQYTSANNYTASLRVVTDSGCRSAYNIQTINVHALPVVKFGIPSICLPDGRGMFTDSSTIADQSEALFGYQWNFGDPNDVTPSLLKNPVHKYAAVGPYNVQLKITSKDGCVDSLQKTITTIYPQPKADFTIQQNEVCMGDTIRFFDNSSGYTGTIQSRFWDLAQGNTSVIQNPFKQFADSGTYNISLYITDTKGCVSDTAVKPVVIDPYPHLTMPGNQVVLENGSIQLKPLWYAKNPVFNWVPAIYLDSATIANPVSSPLQDITYQLNLTGKGNCNVSGTVFIKVLLGPVVPNVFSPNGDGINDTWVIQYLESYPGCEIEVFSRGGQSVYKTTGYSTPWDGNYNGKPLPIGTYYYIINPKNGRALMSGSVTIIK